MADIKTTIADLTAKIDSTKNQVTGIIANLKLQWALVKANWKISVAILVVGFVAGALLIGPLAAGIQKVVDKVKFADKKIEEVKK